MCRRLTRGLDVSTPLLYTGELSEHWMQEGQVFGHWRERVSSMNLVRRATLIGPPSEMEGVPV